MINELTPFKKIKKIGDPMLFREALLAAEQMILDVGGEKTAKELPIRHYFCNGLYARELFIPKGTVLTGAIHKTNHLCVMFGDIEIQSEFGGGRFKGYRMFESKPGIKRIGYAHEDTYFTTLHSTELTDPEVLEKVLTSKTYEEYNEFLFEVYRYDYNLFLEEFGLTEDLIEPFINNTADQIPMPIEFDKFEIKESPIHGQGFFSNTTIKSGEILGPARLGIYRTPAGRYINHSPDPNVIFYMVNEDIFVQAIKEINVQEEVLVDYKQVGEINNIKEKFEVKK